MVQWLERNRSNLAALLVVLVAVAAAMVLQLPRRPALQVQTSSLTAPPTIKVHVTGAVSSPGVYQLPADARVEDALKAAGGPSQTAALASLNLATPLRDGQQLAVAQATAQPTTIAGSGNDSTPSLSLASVPVPTAVPSPGPRPSPTPRTGKLDLNSATMAELDTLPGIGPVTGQRILDYRAKNGGFRSIDELRTTKIVNSATWEKIKDQIEVR